MNFLTNRTFPKFNLTLNTDIHWLARVGKVVTALLVKQWLTIPPSLTTLGSEKQHSHFHLFTHLLNPCLGPGREEELGIRLRRFWSGGSLLSLICIAFPREKGCAQLTLAETSKGWLMLRESVLWLWGSNLFWHLGRTEWHQVRPGDGKPGTMSHFHLNLYPHMGQKSQTVSLCWSRVT